MQPNQQNPYDFITAAPQKKQGFNFGGGNSQKARILQVGLIAAVLVVILIIFLAVLSNARKGDSENLYKIAAAQQDIVDITTLGNGKIRGAQLNNTSITTNLVVASQNTETLSYLASKGIVKPTKQVALYQVKTYAQTLDDANKNGSYDDVYAALLANRIDDYRVKLQAGYSATSNNELKNKLSGFYQQLEVLAPTQAAK